MYPLDQMTNACRPVTLAGRTFPVRQLKLREWGELQAWLKAAMPGPVALAIRALSEASKDGPVPQPVQDALFRQAQEEARSGRWPPRPGSPAWFQAIGEIEGGDAQFLRVVLGAGGTAVSEGEAAEIAESVGKEDFERLIVACLVGEPSVPKAEGEGTPPSPTTGDGSTSTSAPSAA